MEDLLKVGVITTTHGIRGEVKVYPTTDADRFLDLEYVLLDTGSSWRNRLVKVDCRLHRNGMRGFVRCSTMLKGTRRKIFYLECGFGV